MGKRAWILLAAAAAFASLAVPRTALAEEPSGMVGTQTCATCHEDQAKGLGQNTHGRLAAGAVPCESCHGPGQAHVDGGGDKTKILNPAKADAAKVSAQCLTCHDKQEGRRFFVGGAHAAEGLSCVSCHGIHSPKKVNRGLLRDGSSTALCLTCHANKEKSLFMRSRHPLREGKMECVSCHDPHGTPTRAMLKAASPNELCFKCHAEMRGPYMFSHSPVVENCMNCHNPHGTNQENMLVRRETRLCQSCHLEGKHQTLSGQVNDTWDSYRMCTNCHVNIHGSNHPSGYKFLR